MEPYAWHTNKKLFGKKRSLGGGGGGGGGGGAVGVEIIPDSDSEESGSLIGGTSFPLATFLWLQQELASLLTFT